MPACYGGDGGVRTRSGAALGRGQPTALRRAAHLRVARELLIVAAMKKTAALALALGLLFTAACKKKEESAAKPADKPAEPAAKPAEPTPPPPPAAPVYSPEAAKKAIGEMAACSSDFNCEAYKTLVGFGAAAAPELIAFAGDTTASADARRIAAKALGEIKAPDAGPKLIEIANKLGHDDFMLQGDLYEAAGKSGGQATFDALIAEYTKAIASSDDDRDIPLRHGLEGFPAESVAWVKANLPTAKDDFSSYADLITDSAKAGDLPVIVELLGQTKDVMARNRLAAKAIELGDKNHFDVFVAGLSSKDEYDRSDAANFLADVAADAPADLKPKLIELLQKGKAGDAGGLTAMGYDEALKKLGAQ